MIEVSPNIKINNNELRVDYIRASGPGGQNVNKVATAVQLRFDVRTSSLPDEVKARLIRLAHKRVTGDEVLLIEAKQYRTQAKNRAEAIQRLIALIRKALVKPKPRKKTKPTKAAREKRLQIKKRKGDIKKIRQSRSFE